VALNKAELGQGFYPTNAFGWDDGCTKALPKREHFQTADWFIDTGLPEAAIASR